ncbi:DUF4817 domain-containing protein [Trichonephila clavipes]|uniref:DUF4817 domain-containing protein n=1 Tax=Trichonephila clavipes TaxID=2585209 RepID=A0A8X6RET1_TRICX|nr:DUF4817 domain-containing protein [Trichonephila clavipes]
MATSKRKAFCDLQFAKKEFAITVQRVFRIKFGCQPPKDNSILLRWYHQFETTGCLCKGKNTGRPSVKNSDILLEASGIKHVYSTDNASQLNIRNAMTSDIKGIV